MKAKENEEREEIRRKDRRKEKKKVPKFPIQMGIVQDPPVYPSKRKQKRVGMNTQEESTGSPLNGTKW